MSRIKISIRNNKLVIDKEEVSLLSGEIHYWRLNPDCWRNCLNATKDMGLKVIASYIPWQYHEYEVRKFDFDGKTTAQRNLMKFIELLESMGFWIIIRPGPYIYSEWVNRGIPDRVAKYHRLHPQFMEAAEEYIGIVTEKIKPHFASEGGRIIILQADNEIDPDVYFYEQQLGMDKKTGCFQEFLEEQYIDIEKLNELWGTNYKSFNECRAITEKAIDNDRYRKRYLDCVEFKFWYVNKYAKWVVDKYTEKGVTIPIYVNTYPVVDTQNWRQLQQIADIVGIDYYPINEFTGKPLDTDKSYEHRKFLEHARYLCTFAKVPYIAEFESGVWHGHHYATGVLKPNHYNLICLSALEAGIAGWNWYMLVNRDNWYGSPINEWGRRRYELFDVFKKIVAVFNRIDVPELKKITDTAVTFDVAHHATGWIDSDKLVLPKLYEADIDYEFFDVETGNVKKPVLFYSGCQWMKEKSQEVLLRYVKDGGNLVIFKNFPIKDDNFVDCNLLGIKMPEGITPSYFKRVELKLGKYTATLGGSVFNYKNVPGKPIIGTQVKLTDHTQEEADYLIDLQIGHKFVVGYHQKIGRGSMMVLGVDPTPDLIVKLHEFFGVDIPSRSLTPDVTTALFKGSNCYYLIAVNNGQEKKAAEIVLSRNLFPRRNYQIEDLFNEDSWRVSFATRNLLVVSLDRKNGTIFKIKM